MNIVAKPFVKWVGGKGQLIPTLEKLLPHKFAEMDDAIYIEPFIGGGAMLFFMLQRFNNIAKAVISDINPVLIKAYKVVKSTPERLVYELSKIQQEYLSIENDEYRKEFYLNVRNNFNTGHLSDIDAVTAFIFLNKTCFNGLYRVNSNGKFNVPFGKYSKPLICDAATIYADSALLQNVEIIEGDFELTERYVNSNTFVYFDPPYRPVNATSTFTSYTQNAFCDAEQIRLKKYFDKLAGYNCFLMLSNSDGKYYNPEDDFFEELYKDYFIERVYAIRAINSDPLKRGKITELLIRNYN